MMAAALQQSTGKTFVVENRGGAGGNIGMGYAAHSEPDGYTILLATSAYSVNPGLYKTLPYDPHQGFRRRLRARDVAQYVRGAASELPAKTMKEFVALAKANPGEIQRLDAADRHHAAAPGRGAENPREPARSMEDVVFKGGGDALQALLSETVQLSSGSLPPAAPQIKAGTLRCLAVTGDARWPDMPDVPTMVEAGYKDFVFATDSALLAPAKTPPEAVKWLEKETLKVLADAGNEGQAVQGRLPGAAERRRGRLGARDTRRSPCSGTSSTRPASRRCKPRSPAMPCTARIAP